MLPKSGATLRIALLLAIGLLFLPGTASAILMVPDPFPFSDAPSSTAGSIDFINAVTGLPAGATQLQGSTGVGDTSLIFSVSMTTGGIDSIGISAFQPSPLVLRTVTGAGWIPGSEPDGLVDITSVTVSGSSRVFFFGAGSAPNPNVDAGETSDLFFISFASVSPNDVISFMISPLGGYSDYTKSATLIPEPASLMLLGAGLVGLAVRRRKGKGR